MSHALTLHYTHSPQGSTRVLVMIDIATTCPLCGYEEIHRAYHGTDFYAFSCERFARLIHHSPLLVEASCDNCAEPITGHAGTRGAAHYAFPDGSGVIRAFFSVDQGAASNAVYTVVPRARLDPQSLPAFEPVEQESRDLFPKLTEELVFARIGRAFSIPSIWRKELHRSVKEQIPTLRRVATGLWIGVAPHGTSLQKNSETLDDALWHRVQKSGKIYTLPLTEPLIRPRVRLHPAPPDGSWAAWLPEGAQRILEETCDAFVYALEKPALKALETTLRQGRIAFERNESEDGIHLQSIEAPNGEPLGVDVPSHEVLRFAASAGMTLGDAGRYYGEMIIARLMGLTL